MMKVICFVCSIALASSMVVTESAHATEIGHIVSLDEETITVQLADTAIANQKQDTVELDSPARSDKASVDAIITAVAENYAVAMAEADAVVVVNESDFPGETVSSEGKGDSKKVGLADSDEYSEVDNSQVDETVTIDLSDTAVVVDSMLGVTEGNLSDIEVGGVVVIGSSDENAEQHNEEHTHREDRRRRYSKDSDSE